VDGQSTDEHVAQHRVPLALWKPDGCIYGRDQAASTGTVTVRRLNPSRQPSAEAAVADAAKSPVRSIRVPLERR
jgi:hypothetical protein